MATKAGTADLLTAISSRNVPADFDIANAGQYLRSLQACLNGTGPCDPSMFGAKSLEHWSTILKDADRRLTYSDSDTIIGDLGTKGQSLTPGSILDFDCIVTASSMDRDRDILKSSGAILDPAAPLLMFHNPEMPVGRLVNKIAQNDRILSARCCVFNTALGRDAAVLIEGGALRISHGFDPVEYEPLKNGRYLISRFEIYEISVVPIPSNPAAVITAFSRGKLHHPFVKSFAKRMFDARTAQVQGVTLEVKSPADHSCTCHKKEASVAAPEVKASDNSQSRESSDSTAPRDSLSPSGGWTNTSARFEDNEGNRGQGPQQGDHDWHERHMANEVVDEEVAGLDRPTFQLDATQVGDPVFAIASGSNTGPQQNPSPNTALANNEGPAGEPGIPTPSTGVVNPAPTNPSTNPGVQRSATPTVKDVNDASYVQPLDSDSASHHDTAGNVNTHVDVDVPHLKAMARVVQHSGKEGSVYLNSAKGYVHHVMHPDDVHPDNAHMYHSPEQIQKMYGCCHGVMGTKCVVGAHPTKGQGYSLVHKTSMANDDGMSGLNSAVATALKEVKDHLEFLAGAGEQHVSKIAKQHVMAAGNRLVSILKDSSLDPTGNPPVQGVPTDNATNATASAHFTGVPSQNVLNMPSMNHFPGLPTENVRAADDANAIAGSNVTAASLGKSTPAAGVTNVPGTLADRPRTDPDIASGVDGINTSESLSEQPIDPEELMKWLEETSVKSPEELEFEAMLAESLFDEVGV
jgi:HK97 family phage prohead protease